MEFFNKEIAMLFVGGIFSILLPVIIIIGKQGHKRQQKREELEKNNTVGNIEQWLDDSFEYKKPNFLLLMTEWSLQPLFIICITNLINHSSFINVLMTFALVLLIFLHELWMAKRHSDKWYYQLLMFCVWSIAYLLMVNNLTK